jgi:folate-binding Fe-S cluster repair protein YgfZ
MINYESLDGVHFQKGCYPGQEVVARSQYRGTIKRRGFIISTPSKLSPGELLYDPSDKEQPIGQVVQVATHLDTTYAFASIQTAHVEQAAEQVKILTTQGEITVYPLPYPLREDI